MGMRRFPWLAVLGTALSAACGRIDYTPVARTDAGGLDTGAGTGTDAGPAVDGLFTPIPLPTGGDVQHLAVPRLRPTRVYMQLFGTESLYYATWPAASPEWTRCPSYPRSVRLTTGLAVHPTNPDHLFVSRARELFESTDGCTTWALVHTGDHNITLHMLTNGVLWLGTTRGLYAWDTATAGPAVRIPVTPAIDGEWVGGLATDETARVALLGARGERMAKSDDGGATWRTTYSGMTDVTVNHVDMVDGMIAHANTQRSVLRTTDGGESWARTDGEGGRAVAALPSDANVVVNAGNVLLRVSFDAGATYEGVERRNAAMALSNVNDLFTLPLGTGVYAAASRGLFVLETGTLDAMGTLPWEERGGGLVAWTVHDVDVEPSDPNRMYVATRGGLLISDDAGQTWRVEADGFRQNGHANAVLIDAADPNIVWVAGTRLYRSTDRADTFEAIVAPGESDGHDFERLLQVGSTLYVGSEARLWVTTDMGASFTQYDFAGATATVRDIELLGPDELLVATSGGLYHTTNGGQELAELLPDETTSVLRVGSRILVGTLARGLLSAPSLGASFTPVPRFEGVAVRDLFALGGDEILAATDLGVHHSTDAGQTWQELEGLAGSYPSRIGRHPTEPRLFVGTVGFGLFVTAVP